MAASGSSSPPVNMDTLINIKMTVNGVPRKTKMPLRDLTAAQLPDKLRHNLAIKPEQTVIFERFSDSAGGYITLDSSNPQVFKTLIRAAKAKLKLRLKVTVTPVEIEEQPQHHHSTAEMEQQQKKVAVESLLRKPEDDAVDSRSNIGSGIFQFREAQAQAQAQALATTMQSLAISGEAPVPKPVFEDKKDCSSSGTRSSSGKSADIDLHPRIPATPAPAVGGNPFSVYCNACDSIMPDAHFHCSKCDNGDYDLCEECVASGKLCPGDGHWLIKRFFKNGVVVNSTTERISPRAKKAMPANTNDMKKGTNGTSKLVDAMNRLSAMGIPTAGGNRTTNVNGTWTLHNSQESAATGIQASLNKLNQANSEEPEKEMPGMFTDDTKTLNEPQVATRTCNSCVVVLPEHAFVTCADCDDFDLCVECHTGNRHGHHPAHSFQAATEQTKLNMAAETMLAAGRNIRHNAICDGCDQKIYGVRHKCLSCPDWDYCNECVKDARISHPRHRFAPIFSPIADPHPSVVRHFRIYCDGPLCSGKDDASYITGVRYKCAVCNDTDFCASCEALPNHHHNHTHPLIKFKTPVNNVSITTENADVRGNVRKMGDRRAEVETKSASTETTPVQQANAATQVQTVAEIKPTEVKKEEVAQAIPVIKAEDKSAPIDTLHKDVPAGLLNAHFVQDSITDGLAITAGSRFTQIWTLRNPGPYAWPAGCSVRYIGGDNMLNVDNGHPASVSDIADATESNVVGREVQVGEEISFKVTLKAPLREGKSISYWRLKAADGTPFGHRLWCDITVKAAVAQPAAPAPLDMLALQQARTRQQQQALQQQLNLQMQHRTMVMRQQQQAMMQKHMQEQMHLQKQRAMEVQKRAEIERVEMQSKALHQQRLQDAMIRLQHQQKRMEMAKSMDQQHGVKKAEQLQAQTAVMRAAGGNPPSYEGARPMTEDDVAQLRTAGAKGPQEALQHLKARAAGTMNVTTSDRVGFMTDDEIAQRRAELANYRGPGSVFIQQAATIPEQPASSPALTNEDKVRKEAAKQRVEHIKAKILKTREERAKMLLDMQRQALEPKPVVDEPAKKVRKIIAAVDMDAKDEQEENLEGSQMIFPKLDKESPASSTYASATSSVMNKGKAAYVENEAGEIERSATPVAPVTTAASIPVSPSVMDDEDFEDDFEALSADEEDDESEDDGFLTDEEYDILDASDRETVVSQ